MRRPSVLLVISFCRQRNVECSRSPKRTWGCPNERVFGGEKNDCSWKSVRDPVWNASCILGGAQGSRPLTIRAGLGVPK